MKRSLTFWMTNCRFADLLAWWEADCKMRRRKGDLTDTETGIDFSRSRESKAKKKKEPVIKEQNLNNENERAGMEIDLIASCVFRPCVLFYLPCGRCSAMTQRRARPAPFVPVSLSLSSFPQPRRLFTDTDTHGTTIQLDDGYARQTPHTRRARAPICTRVGQAAAAVWWPGGRCSFIISTDTHSTRARGAATSLLWLLIVVLAA